MANGQQASQPHIRNILYGSCIWCRLTSSFRACVRRMGSLRNEHSRDAKNYCCARSHIHVTPTRYCIDVSSYRQLPSSNCVKSRQTFVAAEYIPEPTAEYLLSHLSLPIRSGRVVSFVQYQVCGVIVVLPAEIALQNALHSTRITLLRIERASRHVRNHAIATTQGILSIAKNMVLRCRLGSPDISSIAIEVTRLQRSRNVLGNDNSTAGSVNNPRSCLLLETPQRRRGTDLASFSRSAPC